MHAQFYVSAKAALYSPDRQAVLLIHMQDQEGYGLPGGHLEKDELPDDAMARELYEEIGVRAVTLERKDFFKHGNGKIILGYTGTLDSSTPLSSTQDESEGDAIWMVRGDFERSSIDQSYKDFVLTNW